MKKLFLLLSIILTTIVLTACNANNLTDYEYIEKREFYFRLHRLPTNGLFR
nr:hypothetical protein QOL21_07950 [Acholeplasma laidlawii]